MDRETTATLNHPCKDIVNKLVKTEETLKTSLKNWKLINTKKRQFINNFQNEFEMSYFPAVIKRVTEGDNGEKRCKIIGNNGDVIYEGPFK